MYHWKSGLPLVWLWLWGMTMALTVAVAMTVAVAISLKDACNSLSQSVSACSNAHQLVQVQSD